MKFICAKCGLTLSQDRFHEDKRTNTGFRNKCKECSGPNRGALFYQANAERLKLKQRDYRNNHPRPKKPKKRKPSLAGARFGRLVALEPRFHDADENGFPLGKTWYLCKCDCGKETEVPSAALLAGNTSSCGCKRTESIRMAQGKRPYEFLYNLLVKGNTKARPHLDIALTYEDFFSFTDTKECHYCEKPIVWVERACDRPKLGYSYNLDRKDNSKGYTKENCVVCCRRCNFAKGSSFGYEEWLRIGAVIKNFSKESNDVVGPE